MTDTGATRRREHRAKRLTDAEYDARLAAQGGVCAICGNPPKSRRLHVDHDHRTGTVRGLLCFRCNRALPNYVDADWLEAAMMYVRTGQTMPGGVPWLKYVRLPRVA